MIMRVKAIRNDFRIRKSRDSHMPGSGGCSSWVQCMIMFLFLFLIFFPSYHRLDYGVLVTHPF